MKQELGGKEVSQRADASKAQSVSHEAVQSSATHRIALRKPAAWIWGHQSAAFALALAVVAMCAPANATAAGEWRIVATAARSGPAARDEACFVMVGSKAYLIGGRGVYATDVFDTATKGWSAKTGPPQEVHHMQCVAYNGSIYIAGGWHGAFPHEQNHEKMFVYDVAADAWSTRPYLPNNPERRRGAASFVLAGDGNMYLVGGNIGGHGNGSATQALFDVYNPRRNTWNEGGLLPDATYKRDHGGGALVNSKLLCVASGRDGGRSDFFDRPVLSAECFDFEIGRWQVGADIPLGRGGAAVGQDCAGRLVVAGGEGFGKAYSRVDVFDGSSWTTAAPLKSARHGTGLAVGSCNCGFMYVASGVDSQGGSQLLHSIEQFWPNTSVPTCQPPEN